MKGVRYVSFAEHSGYGLSAQAYMKVLLDAGVPVQWLPLVAAPGGYAPWNEVDGGERWLASLAPEESPGGPFGPQVRQRIGSEVDYDTVVLHCVPEYWPLYAEAGKHNLGYTVWETDGLPPHWIPLLNGVDQVLVPCRFNKPLFERCGVERPVDVVPHALPADPAPVTPDRAARFRALHAIPEAHFVFYATDVWSPRKAPWKTLHALLRAFTADDEVSFVFKTSARGPRSGAEVDDLPTERLVQEILAHYPNPPHVVVIRDSLSDEDVETLHGVGDCYVSLTHAEGWGLGAFQAAAAGRPVVMTGWGGQLDYLGAEWPYLVDFEMTPVIHAQGRGSYLPTQRWASASIEHAIDLLRAVRRSPERARAEARTLAERIRLAFNERVVGARLLEVLHQRGARRTP